MENMRAIRALFIIAVLLLVLILALLVVPKYFNSDPNYAPAELVDTPTVTSEITTQPAVTSQKKLGMSLGPLVLKMSQAEVLKVMGEPQQRTVLHGNGSPEWDYPGLVVGGEPVWLLSAKSPYLAVTAEGFRLGDDKETFQRLYNTSRLNEYKAEGEDQLTIQDSNVMLNVHFDSQGRSQAIVLSCLWHNETNSFC